MNRTLKFLIFATIASTLALIYHPCLAQARQPAWPVKPVRLVVGFPAGGGADAIARHLTDKLGPGLGQPVVVDNKPGAGSTLGAAVVAQAAPDGYTLLLGSASNISTPQHIFKKLADDPRGELIPGVLFGRLLLLLTGTGAQAFLDQEAERRAEAALPSGAQLD